MRRAATLWMRGVIAALLALGIVGAVVRGIAMAGPDPAAFDREQARAIAALAGLDPRSAQRERLEVEIAASTANLNEHPRATFVHLIPGALLFLLAPLQFSRRLRTRHPSVHRWNGRFLLVLVVAGGGAGIFLGLARPYGGALESLATTVFGGFFLFAAARGYVAIRARRVAAHREWMIRMFAIAAAISVIRLFGLASILVYGTDHLDPQSFAMSLWIGWLFTIAAAELWILGTRPRAAHESSEGLQTL